MDKNNDIEEPPFDELAEVLLERLQEASLDCKDPYDLYVNRIQANIYTNPSEVCTRIQEGYRLLLQDLYRSN